MLHLLKQKKQHFKAILAGTFLLTKVNKDIIKMVWLDKDILN